MAAALAAVAAAGYLASARGGEAALEEAGQALAARDARRAVDEAKRAGDARTVSARAAQVEARARLIGGDVQGALARLRDAAADRPNDWRVRRELAVLLAAAGLRAEARREALATLELNPRATLPASFVVRSGQP